MESLKSFDYHRIINSFSTPLLRKTIWLILSTAVLGICGFVFWIIAARHYNPITIGIASTLISVITLLSALCLLGLNIAIINHIPKSKEPNTLINSASVIVLVASLIPAIIFCIFAGDISSKLNFLRNDPTLIILFVFFAILTTWDSLIEGVFIAYKDTFIILIKNLFINITKVILVLAILVGLNGLFIAYYLSLIISPILSYSYLSKKFDYKFRTRTQMSSYRKVMSTSFGNYIESLATVLPPSILPLLLITTLGPAKTAYYYIAMTLANAIYTIPRSVARNFIVELSTDAEDLKKHVLHAFKILSVIIIPIIIIIILFGKIILNLFGRGYAINGYGLLILLALSTIFVSASSIYWALFNAKNIVNKIIWINLIGTILILLLCYLLMPIGLLGIGFAWFMGQFIQLILYMISYKKYA